MPSRNLQRLNLLLITAGCDSAAVGESYVAYQWVSRLAQHHNVTLLTYRYSSKPALQLPGVKVVEWRDIALFERWNRFNALLKPGYIVFYWRARRWIRNALRSGGTFDVIHQITPNALRYPSPAAGLGVPFVIGPRGGSLGTPDGFARDFGKVPWYTQLRRLDQWRFRNDVLLRRTYREADAIIGMAPYVQDLLERLVTRESFEFMPDVGVAELPPEPIRQRINRRVRLLFVGRVIRSKGVRDLIRAMGKLRNIEGLSLDILGVGEDAEPCKREARNLGVEDRILFHGWLPRAEVNNFYENADVFVFPSFREPSSGAVVEAMSYGLPMIVTDRGGPGFMVDQSCGFRIPVLDPDQFASDIAESIRKLVESPQLRMLMGSAAREKVRREFLWEAKVNRLNEIYRATLGWRDEHKATVGEEVFVS